MPLLSLAHALKKASPDCRVVYIGQKGESLAGHLQARFDVFDEVYYIPAGKFRRYHGESLLAHLVDLRTLGLNARDSARVLAGIGYAWRYLKSIKPDVVFSKGGFVAVPVGIAASSLRIPIVTHDSDTVPGLANRIVGRFARIHATGMPPEHYDYPKESIHYVGIPVDERIKPVTGNLQAGFKKQLGLPAKSRVLLVGGAGLGAQAVNDMALAIAPALLESFEDLRIIHITGQAHENSVAAAYESTVGSMADRIQVIGFSPDFYKYTGAADLVVTRAGATTIAELAIQRKALVIIPAPHLTGGHQLKNADELAKKGAAVVVANEAPPKELLEAVEEILKDKTKRQKLADNLGSLAKADAADKIAELLLEVASGKSKA